MMKKDYFQPLERKYQGTTHISAKKGEFAKTVIFPGDPLRAKYIAETYLKNAKLITSLRGMLGYTGIYNGRKVSVMGSGMGIPSASIYSYELLGFYDVDNIIRVGTCGAYSPDFKVGDLIVSKTAQSESSLAKTFKIKTLSGNKLNCSSKLLKLVKVVSKKLNFNIKIVTTHTSDNFYHKLGVNHYVKKKLYVAEMESFAIYTTALATKKNAITIATLVNNIVTGHELTPMAREKSLDKMIRLALEMAHKL